MGACEVSCRVRAWVRPTAAGPRIHPGCLGPPLLQTRRIRRNGPHGTPGAPLSQPGDRYIDLVHDLVHPFLVETVNVHEAKTHLSRLLARVAAGEEIVIAKAGRAIARLVPVPGPASERELGIDRGRVTIADDFDAPLPEEVLSAFEG